MKRAVYFILIASLALIFYLDDCPTEIAEKTIVTAIGIDTEEDGYLVTMQIFKPEGSGSDTAVDPSLPNISILKGKGKTVKKAVEQCKSKLGGEMYIGKNRIIVFGKETDFKDIEKLTGYFLDDPECCYKVDCAAADGRAEKLLELPVLGGAVGSERFTQMIRSAKEKCRFRECTLDELYTAMKDGSKSIIMPMFGSCEQKTEKSGESAGGEENEEKLSPASEIILDRCSVFENGLFAYSFDST